MKKTILLLVLSFVVMISEAQHRQLSWIEKAPNTLTAGSTDVSFWYPPNDSLLEYPYSYYHGAWYDTSSYHFFIDTIFVGWDTNAFYFVKEDINKWKLAHANKNEVGFVQLFAGQTPPTGWLVCNGAAVSRQTYSELFNVIGTTYGSGDGSTTFNLPDIPNSINYIIKY